MKDELARAWVKRCMFCGQAFSGQKKNFEHIIPRWLTEEADLRKREMKVILPGIERDVGMGRIGMKVCETCNSERANLEADAKAVFIALKSGHALQDPEVRILLDWLDKIRVGLWLWLVENTKDSFGTRPKFWINQRIAYKDRVVLVKRYPQGTQMRGLAFWGLGTYFIGLPSALGLLINNIALVSISADFFVTRHIRDVRVRMTYGTDQTDKFEVLPGYSEEPRYRILGAPSIFGQCIAPTDVLTELNIPILSKSLIHNGWSESPIIGLDNRLREVPSASTRIDTFDGNVLANTTLMDLNTVGATSYLLQMLSGAAAGEAEPLKRAQRASHTEIASAFAKAHLASLKEQYFRATGLMLS
jgi:hypothetical protein